MPMVWHGRPNAVFVFPDASELRFVEKPPRIGSRVHSQVGEAYVVEEVLRSGINTYTIRCVPAHASTASVRDLAADLLERARSAISPTELRRRRRERDYLP